MQCLRAAASITLEKTAEPQSTDVVSAENQGSAILDLITTEGDHRIRNASS
jgi:hypothetical protein